MNLEHAGWNDFFENQYTAYKDHGLLYGRIIKEVRHTYIIYSAHGEINAEVSGHFHYTAIDKSDYPSVGDWVIFKKSNDMALIEKVLSRQSYFSRKSAGKDYEEQIVAANIDYLCIVSGLDGGRNFNPRGIERYVAMATQGNTQPIILLNKVDLCTNRDEIIKSINSMLENIPVFMVSATTKEGLDTFLSNFNAGSTIAFSGQSGVGKSSLINTLLGNEHLKTGTVRDGDLRGKHTTTHRELFFLKNDIMVIDTPGMRELQLWGDEDSLEDAFIEIYDAAEGCRFKDCTHVNEPGCAVKQMVDDGSLDKGRYENYLQMRSELQYLDSKVDTKGRLERKAKEKGLSKVIKNLKKIKKD